MFQGIESYTDGKNHYRFIKIGKRGDEIVYEVRILKDNSYILVDHFQTRFKQANKIYKEYMQQL